MNWKIGRGISLVTLLVLGWTTSCGTGVAIRKNVENQSEISGIESCGTILSAGESDDSRVASGFTLIAQAAVCGKLEGNDEPWQALGLTISTPEVFVKSSGSSQSGLGQKSVLMMEDGKVFALSAGQKTHIGNVVGDMAQDSLITLAEGVQAELLVDGKKFIAGDIDQKSTSENKDVVFLVP